MITKKAWLWIFILIILACPVLSQENLTINDTLAAIEVAEDNMLEMAEVGFSVTYINDTIITAKKTLEKVDEELFFYSDVIVYTDEVSERKIKAYNLNDQLRALDLKILDYESKKINIDTSQDLLKQAQKEFFQERYDQTESLIIDTDAELENHRAQRTLLNVMTQTGKGFFSRYWLHFSITLIIILIIAYIAWVRIRSFLAKKKLKILKLELKVLETVMKETQMGRYETGEISAKAYMIRMEVFKSRAAKVKNLIPVLESIITGKKIKSS